MENLDASYALLNDINARNRELQARLRSSLPLLWMNNALVRTSASGPRRRRGGGLAVAEQSVVGEADQMLLALEGQSSALTSRPYKRRVEWEVARRIARVDRELQQYPPTQRFWNQKRKDVTRYQSASYKQRVNGIGKPVIQGAAGILDGNDGQRKDAVNTTARRRGEGTNKATGNQQNNVWMRPKVGIEFDGEVRRVMKHAATSPLHGGVVDTEDTENMEPNTATRAPIEAKIKAVNTADSPVLKNTAAVKLEDKNDSLDEQPQPVAEEITKGNKPKDPAGVADVTSKAPSSQSAEVRPRSPSQVCSSPTDSPLTKEINFSTSIPQEIEDNDIFEIPHRTRMPAERASSSIGRQVLSEFRTMPSVASFGAQSKISGGMGNTGNMRLNADVLRRLFNDLDTDKDSHVNRIETCIALHRLQISVPTTKIISFFRHMHSSDAKDVRGRHAQHLPMKEVINYKEFVAFVTAAYDQQQQRQAQRSRASTRRKVWTESASPLSVPSTSFPIYAHPTNLPRANRSVRASPPPAREDVRVYEVNDVRSEQGEAAIEDRVIKKIPDLLVSRMLAGTSSAASVEAKENAVSVVRRSLESLVGKEAVDDKVVTEITQELIRERLRNIGTFNQDNTEDITGLKRAAAYYEEQMVHGGNDSNYVAEDLSSEDLVNWIDILTEEQVSCLVQQIWKDRQDGFLHVSQVPSEDGDLTEILADSTVKWRDEATDTDELSAPATISEKAVQACDEDNQKEPVSTPQEITFAASEENLEGLVVLNSAFATVPDLPCLPQTHLGRAISNSLNGSGHDNSSQLLFNPVTSIGILQRLRHQRRMHQVNEQQAHSPHIGKQVKSTPVQNGFVLGEESICVSIDRESLYSSEEDLDNASSSSAERVRQLHREAEKQDVVSSLVTEPVLLTQKMLDLDDSASHASSLELVKSMSVSSSGFNSNSDDHRVYGISQEIDHHQHHDKSRSIRRRRPYQRTRQMYVSGSSVPDSLCSAELSEGELSREEALDLSDGEIFGESKRKYTRHMNKTLNVMEIKDEGSLHSSVESGELPELPALMKTHANFRRQLVIQSSSSSVESGELEDGVSPDISGDTAK